jgi:integrase/recombinase XerD
MAKWANRAPPPYHFYIIISAPASSHQNPQPVGRNGARSRNTRLAVIRSFFRYVAMNEPAWLLHCRRKLAIPSKRYVKRAVTFLDTPEIAALLAAPNRFTWAGQRDHIILLVALQIGLRASELIGLRCGDVVLGTGAHIRCLGKGEGKICAASTRHRRGAADMAEKATW